MGAIEQGLSKYFPKFRQQKWAVGVVMVAEAVWITWAAYIRPLLDAVGRYDLAKSDWPTIKAGALAAGHAVAQFTASPITAIAIFIVGFGFLYLDKRFGSAAGVLDVPPPTELPPSPKEGALKVDSAPAMRTLESFHITRYFAKTGLLKREDGSLDYISDKPSGTGAFIQGFTNEDSLEHSVTARLIFSRLDYKHRRHVQRVVENPVWLGGVGNTTTVGVHAIRYLVLFVEHQIGPGRFYSLEDHRLTPNEQLGIESRELSAGPTEIEVEITVDGMQTEKISNRLSINLKTYSLIKSKAR